MRSRGSCGHATIATCHALVESGRLPPTKLPARIVFETLRGPLPVSVEPGEGWGTVAWMGRVSPQDGVCRLRAEQGDECGRPGRLALEVTVVDGAAASVRVGGEAVTVLRGEVLL